MNEKKQKITSIWPSRAFLRCLFCLCISVLCLFGMQMNCEAKAASGRTYYVATKGNNRNAGTKSKPFKTIQRGVSKLKAGDTLMIEGGTYYEEVEIPQSVSGKKGKVITIRNVPGERAIISGKGKKAPILMTLEGNQYLTIRGLEFVAAHGKDACAISVKAKTKHFTISDNKIHDIKVSDPSQEDCCASGIQVFGDGNTSQKVITDGLITNNKISDCETGWSEAIAVSGNCSKIRVNKNRITDTGNIGIDFSGNYGYCSNPALDFPRDCEAMENTVSKCVSGNATSYGIYVDGGQNILIKNNTVTKSGGGIEVGAENLASKERYATKNIKIINNQLEDNIKHAITIGGYEKKRGWVIGVLVSGNICKNNGKYSIVDISKCKNIVIRNNVFHNASGNAAVIYSEFSKKYTKNVSFSRNTYYNGKSASNTEFVYLGKGYYTFSSWVKAVGDRKSVYKK